MPSPDSLIFLFRFFEMKDNRDILEGLVLSPVQDINKGEEDDDDEPNGKQERD